VCKIFKKKKLEEIYNVKVSEKKNEIKNVENIYIDGDGWTNLNNTYFYAINGHYIDNNFQLKKSTFWNFNI